MLSCEIRINGKMIGHIYARNITQVTFDTNDHQYLWEYYKPESRSAKRGRVSHKRDGGIEKLVSKILAEASK